jgi:hypothetical protein
MAENQPSSNGTALSFEQLLAQHEQLDQQLQLLGNAQLDVTAPAGQMQLQDFNDIVDKICQVYSKVKPFAGWLSKIPYVGLLFQLLDMLCANKPQQSAN